MWTCKIGIAGLYGKPMFACVHAKLFQSCPTLCDPLDCSLPGSSAHGVLQTKILGGLPCPPPGDLPDPGIEPESLTSPVLAGAFFTTSAPREAYAELCKKVRIIIKFVLFWFMWEVLLLCLLTTIWCCQGSHINHSDSCVMVSYCFDVQFPGDIWCWTPFCGLIDTCICFRWVVYSYLLPMF